MKKQFAARAILALFVLIMSWPAFAQSSGFSIELPEVRNYAAAAVGVVPDYLGSNDYTVGVAPAGIFKFGDSERYAKLTAYDLNVNLIDSKNWSLGPAANYRFGRKDVNDRVVDRMRDVDGTVELGLFGGWTWIAPEDPRHRFTVGAEGLHDAASEHDGFLVTGSVRYFKPVLKPLTLSIGASLTYGSSDYTKTYFSVDLADSARSGLSPFKADGGLRDIRVPMMAIFSFNENWHLAGGLIYSRLLGDAADSPVTSNRGSKNQLFAGVGLAYAW